MCGIVGVLNLGGGPVEAGVVHAMGAMLAHRGPDGEGYVVDGPVALGHRRLAIIDLSPAARQPMANETEDVFLTLNGEIYEFGALRETLSERGHRFRSHGDAETVVHAYEEWGPACVARLNGMFAFAIWDRRTRTLLLARDRYGIKPLYYTRLGATLLFASEVKAFLKHPAFRVRVSEPHLLEYFTFQNVFTDGTLFEGVHLLPPGHVLRATASGASEAIRLTRYWDYAFEEPAERAPTADYEAELDRRLQNAVERQLVSDVPVGAYLSSGLDSGSVTAIAAPRLPYLRTFTCGFDLTSASGLELAFDEREKAEALSYLLKTEHYEVVLKAGDMERCLGDLVWHLEDLRVGQCYPNYYVARLASKFVKVVLSGTGGDEMFAGYPWRYYCTAGVTSFDEYVEQYYTFWHRLIPNRVVARLFRPHVRDRIKEIRTIDIFRSVLGERSAVPERPEDYVNLALYFEAKTFLHGLFVVEDKLSMAHGLETRVPFMDNDLVDFAMRLPVALKLRDTQLRVRLNENETGAKPERYFQQTRDGKLLLRRVASRYVPEEVSERVKRGFSAPDASWFKGDSMEYVRSVVYDPRSRIYDFLDPGVVQELVAEHLSGQTNRRLLIWSLLCFETWLRTFADASTA
jgi:asparagine synthase (glutamine-hydrolysing)